MLVDDLVLFLIEDPALVVGSPEKGKETDNQGYRVFPNKNISRIFLSGDDQGDEDQQPDEESYPIPLVEQPDARQGDTPV